MRNIDKLIIHCSDTPESMDIGFQDINRWHKEERNFPHDSNGVYCGYHFVIRRSGFVENARLESEPGVHCRGSNATSIAICLVGQKNNYTKEQIDALLKVCVLCLCKYSLKPSNVYGHTEINPAKTCPEMDMAGFREKLKEAFKEEENECRPSS